MDDAIATLKRQPSQEEIHAVLKECRHAPSSPAAQLQLVAALLDFTVPETYVQLPVDVKGLVADNLRSVVGLGNIVARLQRQAASTSGSAPSSSSLVEVYRSVLESVLTQNLTTDVLKTSRPLEVKEFEKLVFKGRIFSVINEVYAKNSHLDSPKDSSPFYSVESYVSYLCSQVLAVLQSSNEQSKTRYACNFIASVFSFHEGSATTFFTLMFTEENWPYYVRCFDAMRTHERKAQLSKFLLSYIPTRFPLFGNYSFKAVDSQQQQQLTEKLLAIASVVATLDISSLIDEQFLEKAILQSCQPLNSLLSALVCRSPDAIHAQVKYLLGTFGDVSLIKSEPISRQVSRTGLLIYFLKKIDRNSIVSISKSREFLDAISNRLGSFSGNVKSLGVVVADKVCELGGQEKIFSMKDLQDYESLGEVANVEKTGAISLEDAWKILSAQVEIVEDTVSTQGFLDIEQNAAITQTQPPIEIGDSDDESDDEDPTVERKARLIAPLYVKDILTYLVVDPAKDNLALEKRRIALVSAPVLIRQKASFGNEVSFYAEDLLSNFLALTNHFDEADFDSLRLNAMVAVLVSYPQSTPYLVMLLSTGDYSLQQRMTILSTISLAARDLRGFNDDAVTSSYRNKISSSGSATFPTKQLPGSLHGKYLSSEERQLFPAKVLESADQNIQNELIESVSKDFKELSIGKVLRVSKKLSNDTSKQQQSKSSVIPSLKQQVLDFPKLVGPQFFYPLITAWHGSVTSDGSGLNIGHYSTVLSAHYIKTLTLLLHCAFPKSPHLKDMIHELLHILSPLTLHVSAEQVQLVESIVTGCLLICDIADGQFLITTYQDDISLIQNWLTQSWESIIDERVKSLAAGLLLRLNSLMENYERLVLDQFNSIY